MKLAASSAAYPTLSPVQLITQLSACGYEGVEWRVAGNAEGDASRPWHYRDNNRCTLPLVPQAMRDIRRACDGEGLSIVALSPYLPVGDLALGERLVALAHEAGTSRLRIWAPPSEGGDYHAKLERFHRFLETLLPIASSAGIALALEVHQHTLCASAALAYRVVEHYSADALKVIYDIGNLAVEGYEHPPVALELLGGYLAHVQLKNARYTPMQAGDGWQWAWCPIDAGVLPLRRILAQLRAHGFADWLSLEDFCTEHSDPAKLSRNPLIVADYWGV